MDEYPMKESNSKKPLTKRSDSGSSKPYNKNRYSSDSSSSDKQSGNKSDFRKPREKGNPDYVKRERNFSDKSDRSDRSRSFSRDRTPKDFQKSRKDEFAQFSEKTMNPNPRIPRQKDSEQEWQTKKPKKNIRIKPESKDRIEETIQEERQELFNQIREKQNPLFQNIKEEEFVEVEDLRVNRFLSKAGFGARRTVETFILNGRVAINGEIVTSLSKKVKPNDSVTLDGEEIKIITGKVVLALNKPAGFLCSHKDVHHEKTVFNLLPKKFARLNMAGRLDLNSRGLLIFSSDGNLIQKLSHPSGSVHKVYHVTVTECPSENTLTDVFLKGIEDEGEMLRAKAVEVIDREKNLIKIVLKEGKKRQIHRMFNSLGIKVTDLQRVQIGKLKLSELKLEEGEFQQIQEEDILEED
jgi:23S rRNA pseudouridine2605 synthase